MMTKQDRERETRGGKIILRAQYDSRRNCWKIVKYSAVGGWTRFGSGWYTTCADCRNKIEYIVEGSLGQYIDEESYKAARV